MIRWRCMLALVALVLGQAAAAGATLRIGIAVFSSSMDPHFHLIGSNIALTRHVFDPLIAQDERQRLLPALAVEWNRITPTTWRFRLRQGVRFHDGTAFTAADVAYTLRRAPAVPNSPGSFALYTRAIARIDVIDAHTLDIHTTSAHLALPIELSTIGIIPRHLGDGVRTADFNAGAAMIGTGPFRFVEWTPGERVALERNAGYWGTPPEWSLVTLRAIANDNARVAALLARDVDLIEYVPPSAYERLGTHPGVSVVTTPSNRFIYLAFDHASPGGSDLMSSLDGGRLPANPFRDRRVRLAVSAAIDRGAITERVLSRFGEPAGQILPPGYGLRNDRLTPDRFDPERARQLLTAAGYPTGFAFPLLTPNDRYINDEQVAQAIAQMLARVGLRAQVDAVPSSVALARMNRGEFALHLWGWGSETGEPIAPLRALLGTRGHSAGSGTANRGRYTNPALDSLLDRAVLEIDPALHGALAREALGLAIDDVALVPLYFQAASWALRAGLTLTPRADGYTLAAHVKASR